MADCILAYDCIGWEESMKRTRKKVVFFMLLIAAGFLIYYFATVVITTQIEQSIRMSLLEASGRTGQITLRLARVGLGDLIKNRLRNLALLAENITFGDLTYRTIELHSHEVVIDRQLMQTLQKFAVSSIGPTVVRAVIEEQELNDYRARMWPSLPVSLTLKDGKVHTRASFEFSFGPIIVSFTGVLLPVAGAIRFQPQQLELQEVVIPQSILDQLLGSFEEALTFDFRVQLPLPVQPTKVEIRDGLAEITLTGGIEEP
jgi:hypothetical protein